MPKTHKTRGSTPDECRAIIARLAASIAAASTAKGDYSTAIAALALYSEIHGLTAKVVRP